MNGTSSKELRIYSTWMICEGITYTLLILEIYCASSMVIYFIRKLKCESSSQSFVELVNSRKQCVLMNMTLLLSFVLTVIRYFLELDTIWGRYNSYACSVLKKVRVILGMTSVMCITITYWIRQRLLYENVVLGTLSNTCTRFISIALLPLFVIVFLGITCYYIVKDMGYVAVPPYGCSDSASVIQLVVLAWATVFMQALLTAMFLFPLIKHRRTSGSLLHGSEDHQTLVLIRRTCFSVAFAVVTNCVCLPQASRVFDVDDIPMMISDINLFVINLGAIFAFSDWKERLLPCINCFGID